MASHGNGVRDEDRVVDAAPRARGRSSTTTMGARLAPSITTGAITKLVSMLSVEHHVSITTALAPVVVGLVLEVGPTANEGVQIDVVGGYCLCHNGGSRLASAASSPGNASRASGDQVLCLCGARCRFARAGRTCGGVTVCAVCDVCRDGCRARHCCSMHDSDVRSF